MATDADIIRTLKDRKSFLLQALSRSIQLQEENESLIKRVKELERQVASRRHQADVWRKKFRKISTP